MRIAVCEDEAFHQNTIVNLVRQWAASKEQPITLSVYSDAESFKAEWRTKRSFDLAFLDIQMKEMNGFELAQYIRQWDMRMILVFVTNFRDFVFRGYEVQAFRYLLKPVKEHECLKALNAACDLFQKRSQESFVFQLEDRTVRLPKSEIYYIESQSHYLDVHTRSEQFRLREQFEHLEKAFAPPMFFRCHRSCMVNLQHVDCILRDQVRMTDNTWLQISKAKWAELNRCFLAVHVEHNEAEDSEAENAEA
jgi:DNA-binding LytR/AlgR family response regulator